MANLPRRRPYDLLRSFASGLVDLAFPPRCACCSAWGRAPGDIARDRVAEYCPVCAGSVGPFEASWDGCGACREVSRRILGNARVGTYGGKAGELVRQYKFRGRHDVEPILVEWLADSVLATRWIDRVEAVTFVPTHWRRAFKSRVHVARSLARGVARRLDLPCIPLLRRTRSGPRQVGLSYNQRLENVRGAFSLFPGTLVRGARALIVDDVRTTGATLEECAKALRKGRAAEVYAAVVARAKGADDDVISSPSLTRARPILHANSPSSIQGEG
jgi:predicted amidophosphoribosyltransferase